MFAFTSEVDFRIIYLRSKRFNNYLFIKTELNLLIILIINYLLFIDFQSKVL